MSTKPELFFCGEREPAPTPYLYKECGLDNIHLMSGFTIDDVDGEKYVNIENVDGLWRAIGLLLVTKRKTFSPKEIRFLRTQMGKTQSELAKLLRVDDQTVARWEKKRSKLPGPADLSLRILFLCSDASGEEGKAILTKLLPMLDELIERDAPLKDDILFTLNDHVWESKSLVA